MTMERLSDDELFTLPMTFMGAPYGRPGPNNKAAILGIPFDCGTSMRIGARGGPDSVRQQSALMRRFNPTLADFDPDVVDMYSLVIIGSTQTQIVGGRMVTPRGYRWAQSTPHEFADAVTTFDELMQTANNKEIPS